MRSERNIIEGLQDIVILLEAQLDALVKAEYSIIVDVFYQPELLFPSNTEARLKCENGGFIKRYNMNYRQRNYFYLMMCWCQY